MKRVCAGEEERHNGRISDAWRLMKLSEVRDDDMARRYVPKTYHNRRALRIVFGTILTAVFAAVVLFLLLFFVLENYYVDGRLNITWLTDEPLQTD